MWFRYKTYSMGLYVLKLCPLLVVGRISEQLSGRASLGGVGHWRQPAWSLTPVPPKRKDARTHSCMLLPLCVYCCHALPSLPWWSISPQQNLSLVLLILEFVSTMRKVTKTQVVQVHFYMRSCCRSP